jgi:hypothetical protein
MSYDSAWAEWTVVQLQAFKEELAGIPVEYRTLEMDVRRNTSAEWKQQATERACAEIDTWKPDLVYTTDDYVQSSVVGRYLNSATPFVFSGVNADVEKYGFDKATNVTGILER